MSARRGTGLVRRLLDLDQGVGDPPALTGRDDVETPAVDERDDLAAKLVHVTDERDDARDAVAALTARIAEVEAARDRMFRDGQAAALALSQVRRLADLWAADPRVDGLATDLYEVLAGGEPR